MQAPCGSAMVDVRCSSGRTEGGELMSTLQHLAHPGGGQQKRRVSFGDVSYSPARAVEGPADAHEEAQSQMTSSDNDADGDESFGDSEMGGIHVDYESPPERRRLRRGIAPRSDCSIMLPSPLKSTLWQKRHLQLASSGVMASSRGPWGLGPVGVPLVERAP